METMTKMGVFAVLPARGFPLLSSALVRVVDNLYWQKIPSREKMITDVRESLSAPTSVRPVPNEPCFNNGEL